MPIKAKVKKLVKKVVKRVTAKKLSILELQEGKIYAAYDGIRLLGKNYRIRNGRIENASTSGKDLGRYSGCVWIPVEAKITFREIGSIEGHVPSETRTKKYGQYPIWELIEGEVYLNWEIPEPVKRKGNQLYTIRDKLVSLKQLSVDSLFSPVDQNQGHWAQPVDHASAA